MDGDQQITANAARLCFNCGGSTHTKVECHSAEQTEDGRLAFLNYQKWLQSARPPAPPKKPKASPLSKFLALTREKSFQNLDPVTVARVSELARSLGNTSRNKKTLTLFTNAYRSFFNDRIRSTCKNYELAIGGRGEGGETWCNTLNQAVKDGKPADFSDPQEIKCYTVDRMEARCRYLYNLCMDDNFFSGELRRLFMPREEAKEVEICSLGGGPGYDHIVLSVMAEFLKLCSCDDENLLKKPRVNTKVFDLYDEAWGSVLKDVVGALGLEESEARGSIHPCDLRGGIESPRNADLAASVPTADLFLYSFVLHENAAFVANDDKTELMNTAVLNLLEGAKVGALIFCMDSGNTLWVAIEAAASRLGWNTLYRDTKMKEGGGATPGLGNGGAVKMGPKSYFLMQRVEFKGGKEEELVEEITVRAAIFDPTKYAKVLVEVKGEVVELVEGGGRFDIRAGGGKLIVDSGRLGGGSWRV
ncbi:hypothetical protein TL16_g00868 [Triparma laevis f. inornata]|uniref:Uncharacterized protein n=1 Tax=Triparma laevis f. inornata TaxID=1714386 RepID=A0A9W6ZIU1_9STRA|nr:hypothetical protein TL16_g00868 [Triparma laevis f. inornata]